MTLSTKDELEVISRDVAATRAWLNTLSVDMTEKGRTDEELVALYIKVGQVTEAYYCKTKNAPYSI
jgi:hypothetical protein